MDPKYTK